MASKKRDIKPNKDGAMIDRVHRELTDEDITRIADTYQAWRGDEGAGAYTDVPGFCKSITIEEVREHSHVLTPGRYVGVAAQDEGNEAFEDTMAGLTKKLIEQMAEARRLDAAIRKNLEMVGIRDNS